MIKEKVLCTAISVGLALAAAPMQASAFDSMLNGENGWTAEEIFTVGESINGYTPIGILDGLGAFKLDYDTVRVLANHELLNFRGNAYEVSDGMGGTFALVGARVSYFDINKYSMQIEDAGPAYDTIYDVDGNVASDLSFLANGFVGFSRLCSSQLVEANEFGKANNDNGKGQKGIRGIRDRIYFTGEEDGSNFNPIGGAEWALDPADNSIWHVPDMGRGAWENITQIDPGNAAQVAFILADDSSPFDADGDGEDEAAPLFLYVGTKHPNGDFLGRNGLRGGDLYVWVSDTSETTPLDFRGSGTLMGTWVMVDNSRDVSMASEDGSTGYDPFGYPTQRNLWTQAESLSAFGFSRPEDVATNPADGTEIVLASTGVDTYAVDPMSGDGADTFGTMYTVKNHLDFDAGSLKAAVTIIYDGDADVANRALRSPDNLDWADDGYIYVQEDEAEEDSLTGEPLFGPGATNPKEASIVKIDPGTGGIGRVGEIDRSVVLDASIADPTLAVDVDAGNWGEWESSGILDVSSLFGYPGGSLFILDVQAHGIDDQDQFNPTSRITDFDLREGGQLLLLHAPEE